MKIEKTLSTKTRTRRELIIRAALACFTEIGYAATNMADIRSRSGASTGSIYHHFKSKEQLARAVYLEGIRDYQEGFLSALKKYEDASEAILEIITYHLTWVEQNPDWSRFLFLMRHADFMGNAQDEFNVLNANFFRCVSMWFLQQVKTGSIRSMPTDLSIAVLLGPCQEYTRLYIDGKACTPPGQAAGELALAAWNALRSETSVE
ncbi:MAG TPA: TetR/AcrR family transcriptional regulator [Deltaproteobacteria bacterium]|nr:TetR/AcrR family transcriptional regulator [Deltaproteobacteria bacterium]